MPAILVARFAFEIGCALYGWMKWDGFLTTEIVYGVRMPCFQVYFQLEGAAATGARESGRADGQMDGRKLLSHVDQRSFLQVITQHSINRSKGQPVRPSQSDLCFLYCTNMFLFFLSPLDRVNRGCLCVAPGAEPRGRAHAFEKFAHRERCRNALPDKRTSFVR